MKNVLVLSGGIGNQLFQVSAAHAIFDNFYVYEGNLANFSTKRDSIMGELLPNHRVYRGTRLFECVLSTRLTYKMRIPFLVGSRNYLWNTSFITGYFQHFSRYEGGIRRTIESLKIHTRCTQNKLMQSLQPKLEHSLAIHLRLGDYVQDGKFWIIDEDYLSRALSLYRSKDIETVHIFCEQDVPRELENVIFSFCNDIIFVKSHGLSDIEEFMYMASFNNLIISNSTFSFWAGMLNYDGCEKRVVAPINYYKSGLRFSRWKDNCRLAGFLLV